MTEMSFTRLAEILNKEGRPATPAEIGQYLEPAAKECFHVSAPVESRLRERLAEVIDRENRWQQELANLYRPWEPEIAAVVATAQVAVMNHATHSSEPRCACWREARERLWVIQDHYRDNQEAQRATEEAWDAMERFSTEHEQPKEDGLTTSIISGIADLLAEQVETSIRDALPFLGTRRPRR